MLLLAIPAISPARAEQVELNHLDCRFNEQTRSMVCPDVLGTAAAAQPALQAGRAAAAPVVADSSAAAGKPAKGTPEWNEYCAGKYRSFDAATGLYKSFSGQMKPCR